MYRMELRHLDGEVVSLAFEDGLALLLEGLQCFQTILGVK